ncbi:hypothetical protein B0H16DRAFT_1775333 [Mycena metata]|uniref:Gag-like protein n=1 Tax=Mycena metata TaxID=1033252 RepID=A0AAD7HXA6_9AGAR|nr:hypothetical protein B0H16DRAFT_1775333 [Mycena metata]
MKLQNQKQRPNKPELGTQLASFAQGAERRAGLLVTSELEKARAGCKAQVERIAKDCGAKNRRFSIIIASPLYAQMCRRLFRLSKENREYRPSDQSVFLRRRSGQQRRYLGKAGRLLVSVRVDAPPGKPKPITKGGARKVSAKQEKFEALREEADAVDSLTGLATILDEAIRTMDANRAAPTKQCMLLLRRIQERLVDHHELKGEDDPQRSFSAILSRAVVTPVKELAEQVELQQRAIQNLSKRLEAVRNSPIASPTSPAASPKSSYTDAASKPKPTPRQAESPLPRGAGERILVRFAGPPPPLFTLRYDEIVGKLNAHLVPLGLPSILFVQKQISKSPGYFIAPCLGKEGVAILEERWADWAPGIIPGCRIVPVVAHCFVQVDGIPFTSVVSFESVVKQFEELNPTLGKVVGLPRWKNAPPNESRIAAAKRDGCRVPSAGSLVLRLESKDMVDRAVANGRVLLAGHAPRVGRTFPHLDVVQCWGCFKYGHVRARCNAPDAKCGGCSKAAHGFCSDTPVCSNCGGAHRADNPVCPVRKEHTEKQKQRAAELCRVLDQQSRYPPHFVAHTAAESPLSPLSPSLNLQDLFMASNPTSALRLHDLQ